MMEVVDETTKRDAEILKKAKKLLTLKNVTGYGLGYKVIRGQRTPIPCLTVLVSKKEPLDALSKRDIIPNQIKGKKTDVIESGVIEALGHKLVDRTKRQRPVPCGLSCGHYRITCGTQGAVVKKDDSTFILSNNHVFANSNEARLGDPIYQPGPYDSGEAKDTYAHLSEFVEIKFLEDMNCPVTRAILWFLNGLSRLLRRGTRFKAAGTQLVNKVDGALAVVREEIVDPIQLELGSTQGINYELCVGDKVKKSGRTSGVTEGEVLLTNGVARVSYGGGRTALFTSQIITSGMLEGGDSISLDSNLFFKENGILKYDSIKALHGSFHNKNEIEVLGLNNGKRNLFPSYYNARVQWSKVQNSIFHGFKPVYRIISHDGKSIEVTDDHSLFTFKSGTSSLSPSSLKDNISTVISVTKELEGNLERDSSYLTFLGLWIADGSWCKYKNGRAKGIEISTGNDKGIVNFLKQFNPSFKHKSKGDYRLYSVNLVRQMNKDGFKSEWNAYSKRIPRWIFSLKSKELHSFLKGYFSGDGWVSLGKHNLIACGSVHHALLEDIQALLGRLGIRSNLGVEGFNRAWSERPQYKILIEWPESVKQFSEKIGFLKEVPKIEKEIRKREHEVSARGIRAVIPIGIKEIYDLKVNPSESFVANGILCHNSGSALLSDDNKVVGLCFAGSSQVGIANRIENVMDELGIEEVL